MKKILVTGGNGFLGHHVVNWLADRGYSVTIFDRFQKPMWRDDVNFFMGDIKDSEAVMEAVGKHDGSINLAGVLGTSENVTTPRESIESNILGAINYYEAIKRHGVPGVQITVGNHTWNNSYAVTKSTAERFALMYNKEFKTKIAVIRGLNVFGPYQLHHPVRKVVPTFILQAMENKNIEVYGDGQQLLDIIYVEDTAEILCRAIINDHGCYDMVMEAGLGKPITANYLAEKVIDFVGSESKVIHLPMRAGEPLRSVTVGDPATLKPLDYLPTTSFEDGLRKTVDWYKEHYWNYYNMLHPKEAKKA